MKKLSILFTALLLLGMSTSALAEVDVYANIYKEKDIFVFQDVDIFKDVKFDVTVEVTLEQAVEADSIANQSNVGNIVRGLSALEDLEDQTVPDFNYRTAIITGSINSNKGIVGVNQDSGNFNNQGNIVGVAVMVGDVDQPGYANTQVSASQKNVFNAVSAVEGYPVYVPVKYDVITNSILQNTGIVGVNQSVGNLNNQLNQVAMAIGDGVAVAMSEADLGQLNAWNIVREIGTLKTDTITGSVNNNSGIVGVNQSAGNMNNQANIVSISATR